ncbi:hypothetical protein [Pseudomonas sp. TNT2022 ID642]
MTTLASHAVLFSYGTLQDRAVQLSSRGRELQSHSSTIAGL